MDSNQDSYRMDEERENILINVKGLMDEFMPPICKTCNKRQADRVCLSRDCVSDDYMSIVCGKCHATKHENSVEKADVDISEYFMKFADFLKENSRENSLRRMNSEINQGKMEGSLKQIEDLRKKLAELKKTIREEINTYQTPAQVHQSVSEMLIKAVSSGEQKCISDQLNSIKQKVIFEKNKFDWKDIQAGRNRINQSLGEVQKSSIKLRKHVIFQVIQGREIDLSTLEVLKSSFPNPFDFTTCFNPLNGGASLLPLSGYGMLGSGLNYPQSIISQTENRVQPYTIPQFETIDIQKLMNLIASSNITNLLVQQPSVEQSEGKSQTFDNLIQISSGFQQQVQYYLNYKLDRFKKYSLRFSIQSNNNPEVSVGLMDMTQINLKRINEFPHIHLMKHFSYEQIRNCACQKIFKGSDLGKYSMRDKLKQIEMRFCIQDQYLDFSDYPNRENVNQISEGARMNPDTNFVLTFFLKERQVVILERFEEIPFIECV